ncbi:MAG: cupin domain-containing protein [Pseudomonadota bacterium]
MAEKINLPKAIEAIADQWDPHVAGNVNGTDIRVAKIEGAFDWHRHHGEAEAFFILKGDMDMEFRDRTVPMVAGDFLVVPPDTEHRPVAQAECWIMLIEAASVTNTGDNQHSDKTQTVLKPLSPAA